MDDFLRRLAPRPSDYGGLPGTITREDDAGNVYDESGRKIFNKFDQTEQPDSWLDTAISTATAPAKLATALVGSLNPYGQDGWQVPPIISEPAAAFARSGESTGFGDDGQFYLPNVQNPQVAQDTLTQLMTVYGGNALNPLARVPKGAIASGMPVRAASKYGDEIFTGRNHGEAYQQAVDKFGESAVDDMLAKNGSLDGFIDETGDFIDRLTANERAGGRGLNAYELLPEQQLPSDFMGVLSDNRPSLMGSALASQADSLPMDQASRLARAAEQGYDTSNVLYRGMDTAPEGNQYRAAPGSLGDGVYLTPDPSHAAKFGDDVRENFIRGNVATANDVPPEIYQRGLLTDLLGLEGTQSSRMAEWARANGYAGFSQPGYQTVVFDPSNIRSVNAAFDPARAGENGLLLSDNKPSLLGSALAGQGEEDLLALLGHR